MKNLYKVLVGILLCMLLASCGKKDTSVDQQDDTQAQEEVSTETEEEVVDTEKYITNEEVNLRELVVQYMYDMANVKWTSTQLMDYSDDCGSSSLVYQPGQTYLGQPYSAGHNGFEVFEDSLDADGNYINEDISWYGPGNACSSSVKHAWKQVSPNVDYTTAVTMMPYYENTGIVPVGDIDWSLYDGMNTINSLIALTPEQDLWEAYAQVLPGDAFIRYLNTGGHALMVTLEPVVTRNADGTINPFQSYVYLTDQNSLLRRGREYPSSWAVDVKYNFLQMRKDGYLPVTIPELQEGKTERPWFELTDAPTAQALESESTLTGTVTSNYWLVSVKAEVRKDSVDGEVAASGVVHPYTKSFALADLTEELALDQLPAGEYCLVIDGEVGLAQETLLELNFTK
ncbi:MAG: hypothetical protein IJ036_05420 [Lachnospiraceae bacterium]|nr:hypothetical protein [Lachnospiraceae bacterium]